MTEVDKSERKKLYRKIYYEIHKDEFRERYLKNREKIRQRNQANREKKSEYDHLRNLQQWERKAEYNREYYRKHKTV